MTFVNRTLMLKRKKEPGNPIRKGRWVIWEGPFQVKINLGNKAYWFKIIQESPIP